MVFSGLTNCSIWGLFQRFRRTCCLQILHDWIQFGIQLNWTHTYTKSRWSYNPTFFFHKNINSANQGDSQLQISLHTHTHTHTYKVISQGKASFDNRLEATAWNLRLWLWLLLMVAKWLKVNLCSTTQKLRSMDEIPQGTQMYVFCFTLFVLSNVCTDLPTDLFHIWETLFHV
jgi:hypothetical protein